MAFALCQWKQEVDDFLEDIGPGLSARAVTLLEKLGEHGSKLPQSKALGTGLFELKVDHKGRALRFFYVFWKGSIVVLKCLDKKTQKIPDELLKQLKDRKRLVEKEEAPLGKYPVH